VELHEHDVDPDPFAQLARWYDDAAQLMGEQADAMVVATATPDGSPSARVVLLRGLDARGLCFYTNHESRKGQELAENPRAAIVMHWPDLGRQVRATGQVTRLDEAESTDYWRNRPRASRISAWASRQSHPIDGRGALEAEAATVDARFADEDIPLPPFWGGYRLDPDEVELWQHRDDRLHDRLRYRRDATRAWLIERLAP